MIRIQAAVKQKLRGINLIKRFSILGIPERGCEREREESLNYERSEYPSGGWRVAKLMLFATARMGIRKEKREREKKIQPVMLARSLAEDKFMRLHIVCHRYQSWIESRALQLWIPAIFVYCKSQVFENSLSKFT